MKKKIIFIIITFLACLYFFVQDSLDKNRLSFISKNLSREQKEYIKEKFFPFHRIYIQELQINTLEKNINFYRSWLTEKEIDYKKSKKNIPLLRGEDITLEENLLLKKYKITEGLYSGINNFFPGSGYIDFHDNNLILLSSKGIIAYSNFNNFENLSILNQIDNNLDNFISSNFKKQPWFSFKDLKINKNNIFVSYTEEIKENCWNTSLLIAKMNYNKIKFEKLYSPQNCINEVINPDMEFNAHQSGGRIEIYDDENVLFSLGDYRSRYLAQDLNSPNGKVIKININKGNYKIISLGNRNAQGLYFDKKNNFILETEHGPKGGDEINLIKINNSNIIQNFGWPISSYGEHYSKNNKKAYDKYPLHKSHKNFNFIEPIKYFTGTIGISEISKISDNFYVFGSLADRSIYFFKLNNGEIIDLKKIKVFERVRDLVIKNELLVLFLEDTASIGIVDLKKYP